MQNARHKRVEVVTTDPTTTEVVTAPGTTTEVVTAAPVAAEQVESVTVDPYAARRATVYKLQQAIYLLFGLLEGLIAIRFVLRLLGANPAAAFAAFIYGITAPFVAPFVGIFGTPAFNGSVLEWHSIVAIIVYMLVAWLLVKVIWLVYGETRTGVQTRRIDTRIR